jgi:hypothetical protein
MLALVCALGCDSATKKSETVGATGGTVALDDGTQVVVPAGALATPTAITVEAVPNAVPPDGTDAVGKTYRFGPEGLTFQTPVVVTLAVAADLLPPDRTIDEVAIFTAPGDTTAFTPLATSVADSHHVSAGTSHFSRFLPVIGKKRGADFGVPTDGAVSSGDLAVEVADASLDLYSAPDLSDAGCPRTFTSNTSSCSLTASCGGHTYQLSCASVNLWSCTCTKDGSILQQFVQQNGICTSVDILGTQWSRCGFP